MSRDPKPPKAAPSQLPSGAWVLRCVIDGERVRLPLAEPDASPAAVAAAHKAVLASWAAVVARWRERKAEASPAPNGPTFGDVARRWTSGELARTYPDHVRAKRSAADDVQRLDAYVLPHLKDTPIAELTLDDVDRVMLALPAHLAPGTRRQVAQVVAKVLALAVYPLKARAANPIPRGWLPRVPKSSQRKQEIPHSDEHDAFLACPVVPFALRLFCGFTAREMMRHDEAERLTWADLDLERGLVRLDENKTDDPREWDLDPGTTRALARWRRMLGDPPRTSLVFVDEAGRRLRVRPDAYRAELARVVSPEARPELYQGGKKTKPTGIHALRALGVTAALAAGRSEAWVRRRTGHKSSTMVATYTGRQLMRPLASLDAALAWPQSWPCSVREVALGARRPLPFRPRERQATRSPVLKSAARKGVRVRDPAEPPSDITGKSVLNSSEDTEARRERGHTSWPCSARPHPDSWGFS